MNSNLSSSSTLCQNDNQSSSDLNISDLNKATLFSLISEFNNKFSLTKNGKENDKQKAEAISNTLQVIEKMEKSQQEYLTITKENKNTIRDLETKNEKLIKKNNDLKNKMDKSNQEYTANINKKNDEMKILEQKNVETNNENTELKTKLQEELKKKDETIEALRKENDKLKQASMANTCVGGKQKIYVNSDVIKESQSSEKDEEIKQLRFQTNKLQTDINLLKDYISRSQCKYDELKDEYNNLKDKYDGLNALNTVLNDELSEYQNRVHNLEVEINTLHGNTVTPTSGPVTEMINTFVDLN